METGPQGMDRESARRAFGWHMDHAQRVAPSDPSAAARERRHALGLAERFGLEREIAEACGALCRQEAERHGAPVTERWLARGLELSARWPGYHAGLLELAGLHELERGELDAAAERFTQARAQGSARVQARALAGLGTVLLRQGHFEPARVRFIEGLGVLDAEASELELETRLRLLDGRAEAERRVDEPRSASATSASLLPLTIHHARDRLARRYRARALSALGLLRWRAGAREEAERYVVASLRLWPEAERERAAEAFVAWERLEALRQGAPAPVEGNPGDGTALAFVRVGREALVPVELPASPPSREALDRARVWAEGTRLAWPLRSVLGGRVAEVWIVTRVQDLRAERRVLVELLSEGA